MSKPTEIASDIQTIVWDLDGTLLDSFGIYRDCLNEVLRKLGRPEIQEQIFRNNHHGFIEDSIANVLHEAGQATSKDELAEIIRDFYVLDNAYIADVDHHLFEDAVGLAERAHKVGKRQLVVTNRPHGTDRGNGSPRNLITNSCLSDYVSDILCGDDSEFRKPYRKFLEARFGSDLVELGKIIVIGDQFVDAEFAHNIGCDAILVTRTDKIAHLERLDNWQDYVQIVPSLRDVKVWFVILGSMDNYDIHKAAGIMIKDRRLLVERSKGKDVFVAPGGKLEAGETSTQAVIRELKEEFQLDITENNLEEFGTFYAEAAGSHNTGKRLRMDVFIVENVGEIVPDSEVEEIRWISSKIPADIEVGSIFAHEVLPRLKEQGLVD